MLKPAKLYEDELNRIYSNILMEDRFKWFHEAYELAEIKVDDCFWNKIQLVSVYNNEVIGYFSATIERTIYAVENLACANFKEDLKHVFAIDLLRFLKYLIREHNFNKINWQVVVGNPAEYKYDNLCNKFGGRIVGTKLWNKSVRGKFCHSKLYEWINDYYKCDYCGFISKNELDCKMCNIGSMVYYNPFTNLEQATINLYGLR